MVVSGKTLSRIGMDLNIGRFILLSDNESQNGGRNRSSILEDTLEAIVAAIYLDGGPQAAKSFIDRHIIPTLDSILENNIDSNYKSQLLELAQGNGWSIPIYRILKESGPDHAKEFLIEVEIENQRYGLGSGKSKKSAQQIAAKNTLNIIS